MMETNLILITWTILCKIYESKITAVSRILYLLAIQYMNFMIINMVLYNLGIWCTTRYTQKYENNLWDWKNLYKICCCISHVFHDCQAWGAEWNHRNELWTKFIPISGTWLNSIFPGTPKIMVIRQIWHPRINICIN